MDARKAGRTWVDSNCMVAHGHLPLRPNCPIRSLRSMEIAESPNSITSVDSQTFLDKSAMPYFGHLHNM